MPPFRPRNTKTVLCKNWASAGSCKYGAKCHFAHGSEELRHKGEGDEDSPPAKRARASQKKEKKKKKAARGGGGGGGGVALFHVEGRPELGSVAVREGATAVRALEAAFGARLAVPPQPPRGGGAVRLATTPLSPPERVLARDLPPRVAAVFGKLGE